MEDNLGTQVLLFLTEKVLDTIRQDIESLKHLGILSAAVLGFFSAFNGSRMPGTLTWCGVFGVLGLGIVIVVSLFSIRYIVRSSQKVLANQLQDFIKKINNGTNQSGTEKEAVALKSIIQQSFSRIPLILLLFFTLSIVSVVVDVISSSMWAE